MKSKQVLPFRALLSVAALAAGGLVFAPAHAQLLGGSAAGGLGGTLSPRHIDANGQLRANAQLPRGEKLRETVGQNAVQARGNVGATTDKAVQLQGAAVDKTLQAQGMASGMAQATAQAGGAIAVDKAATVKQATTDVAGQATSTASVTGGVSVKPDNRGVSVSASGQAKASR